MSNSETPTSNGHHHQTTALSPREQAANDKLAALLMECAISVKRGERSSIVRQTIHGLNNWYKQGEPSSSATASATTTTAAAVPAASASANNSTVTKPTKPPHAFSMLGKMVGLGGESVVHDPKRTQASKDATSAKNAARVRAELNLGGSGAAVGRDTSTGNSAVSPSNGNTTSSTPVHPPSRFAGHHDDGDWCDVHFTMGCACKSTARSRDNKMPPPPAAAAAGTSVASSGESSSVAAATTAGASSGKPSFQRPVNPKSPLIANGWMEQQRRSKMRTVWKDVLASLVEARKPTEETTLWIQREVTDASGKSVLEALHQIPIKWLEEIQYVDFSADHRFTLKVYNLQEEFVFRCARDDEAAQNWVLTLRSAQEIAQKAAAKQRKQGYEDEKDEKKLPDRQQQQSQQQQYPNQPSQYPPPGQGPPPRSAPSSASSSQSPPPRVSVKELRAIAHGVGINTYGMERIDLERIVEQVMQQQNGGPPPGSAPAAAGRPGPPGHAASPSADVRARAASAAPEQAQNSAQYSRSASDPNNKSNSNEEESAKEVEERRRKMAEVEARRKTAEAAAFQEKQHRQKMEERAAAQEVAKRKAAEEDHGRRLAESVKEQQEAERRRRQDEERKQMEEDRRKRDEEDHRRRVAEQQAAEQRRREEEARLKQQAQWQQQQQNWQKQQAEDEQRKRAAEQQAAEERRRQEEAYRRQQQQQQQWHQQQQQQQQQQQWQQQNPPQQPGYHTPNQQFYRSTPGAAPHGPPRGQQAPPHAQQQQQQQQHPSQVNQKYAKMAHQTDDDSQMTIHAIKHGVLVEWALQPPNLQALRPIEVLITTIHKVFPPKFGVPGHAHFAKWKPITPVEVSQGPAMGNRVDDEKLKKAIKKLRFFLHPDKLPHEFNSEQLYICKMLWDITSDASEEYKKKEEDLSWMR